MSTKRITSDSLDGDEAVPKRASKSRGPARRAGTNIRRELMREKMLEKAAELFFINGYAKTTIIDIADSLSLGRSSVYHYFPNKDAILQELFAEEFGRRLSELQTLYECSDLNALQRLTLAVEGAIAQRVKRGNRFLVFGRLEAEVPDELRHNFNRGRRQILEIYTNMITDGIRDGEFRAVDPQLTAFALIGMSNWTALWYSPNGRINPADMARTLTELLVKGIERRDSDPAELPKSIGPLVTKLREQVEQLEQIVFRQK